MTVDGKPKTYEYDFGKAKGEDLYARQSQSPLVFTVSKGIVIPFSNELLDRTVFKFDPSKVKSLKLTGWKKIVLNPLTISFGKEGSSWTAREPKDTKVDSAKVERLLANLANLKAEKFVSPGTKPKPEQELDVKQGGAPDRSGHGGR